MLKETQIAELKCAAAPSIRFVSAPLGMPAPRPSLGSLSGNGVGEKGATAIAAVLNETKITKLKCATTPECSPFCQRPLTRTCPLALPASPTLCSIWGNKIGDKGASALAAVLKETRITQLECAAAPECCVCVSAR